MPTKLQGAKLEFVWQVTYFKTWNYVSCTRLRLNAWFSTKITKTTSFLQPYMHCVQPRNTTQNLCTHDRSSCPKADPIMHMRASSRDIAGVTQGMGKKLWHNIHPSNLMVFIPDRDTLDEWVQITRSHFLNKQGNIGTTRKWCPKNDRRQGE